MALSSEASCSRSYWTPMESHCDLLSMQTKLSYHHLVHKKVIQLLLNLQIYHRKFVMARVLAVVVLWAFCPLYVDSFFDIFSMLISIRLNMILDIRKVHLLQISSD